MKKIFKNKDDINIEVGNTFVSIQPYKIGDISNMEYRLSTYDNVYHRVIPIGLSYDIETKKMYFPKCIDVEKISKKKYGAKNVIIKNIKSDSKTKVLFNLKYPPRNDLQIMAIDFLVGRGKFTNNRFYSRLLLSLETGEGKTFCSLAAIQQIGYRAAVIVHDTTLIDRWVEEILKVTDISEDEIYIVQGNKSFKKISKKIKNKKIILISHRTISSFAKNNGWEYVRKFFSILKIGIKIFDEAHTEFKNIVRIDLHSNTEKSIYLTASAGRSVLKEDIIYNTIFANVPKLISQTKTREENHINMAILEYNSNPSFNDKARCKTKKGFSMSKFMEYSMSTGRLHFESALEVVINTIFSSKTKGRVLIMLGSISMIFRIKGFLEERYPSLVGHIGVYCSAVSSKEKKYSRKEAPIILSTYKSLGTGVDIDGLKFVVMAEPYSSKIIAKQAPGRLRENGWYFELVDKGFTDCERQFNSRKKFLIKKANKFKIIKM